MLYDKPVRDLLEEAVSAMPAVFRGSDLVLWFNEHYPLVKETTVRTHISCATVNLPSRRHCYRDQDLLFKRADGRLERHDSTKHGGWMNGQPLEGGTPLEPDENAVVIPQPARSAHVAQVVSEFFGTELQEDVLALPGGVTHRFDFVGPGRIVGVHGDKDAQATVGERWNGISEAVWLLQLLEQPGPRFVLFSRDRRIARLWLGQFERLCSDVEFLFLDGTTLSDLKEH